MPILRQFYTLLLTLAVFAAPASGQQQGTMQEPASAQAANTDSKLRLAGVFGNAMVLQQQSNAPIWGTAQPNATVSVAGSWSEDVATTKADKQGKWKTSLATPAAGGPFLVAVESGSQRVQLKNVLVGEVWICSGQSNMQWKMRGFGVEHFGKAVATAKHPQIRYCQVSQILALEPQEDIQTKWSVCSPKTVLDYSAVAYFFAERLHRELDVPIGLISTNWGGSPVEAWISEDVIAKEFTEFDKTRASFATLKKTVGVVHPRGRKMPKGIKHGLPSVLYNQMIHPLVPFAMRGVIWYQGESNVDRPGQYEKLFPSLINRWRDEWNQGEFPFYYVQIAPFNYSQSRVPAALLRETQFKSLSIPNTGMAVTMDIGEAKNIHPKAKQPVGERLAIIALARDYGRKKHVYSGPLYSGHQVESGQLRLQFQHAGGGLASRDGKPLSHFTIAGDDKSFVAAEAVIDGDSIIVRSEQIQNPVAVRFGWGNADAPNLMNREGLPASSFRTDDWQRIKSK